MADEQFVFIPHLANASAADFESGELDADAPIADMDGVPAWGLARHNGKEFRVIYAPGVIDDLLGDVFGLLNDEADSIVPATLENTPDEAWAALARYRLTEGGRQ